MKPWLRVKPGQPERQDDSIGLGGQRRVSQFKAWKFESFETVALTLEEDKPSKEVVENPTVDYTPLISCIQGLRNLVSVEERGWLILDRQPYSSMNAVFQQDSNTIDAICYNNSPTLHIFLV